MEFIKTRAGHRFLPSTISHLQHARQYGFVIALALMMSLASVGTAVAAPITSPHYMVNESQFGTGSSLNDCSAHYCAKTSTGDTVVGQGTSDNYSANFGFNTTDEPYLQVITSAGTQDMGTLDVDVTGTATSLIKVRTYLADGYVMQITGPAPNQGTHTLTALTTPTTSHQGAEQFGINFAANTSPAIGANPLQVPSSAFSFGQVASDYSSPNLFKYVDGDIVAQSDKSSGETDYTMSMIINVSNVTPGGRYNGVFSAVVTPVF